MKYFLKKILVFSISSFLLIIGMFITSSLLVSSKANFSLEPKVKNIILGNSHTEFALNDSLIVDFKNLSQSRQSYFYTYSKLKNLISQNDYIENVFINYSNNVIDIKMNKWIWDDLSLTYRSEYFPFLEMEELNLLYKNNYRGFISGIIRSFRRNLISLFFNKLDYTQKIGGYKYVNRVIKDSLKHLSNTYPIKNKQTNLSHINIEYLKKIISYCQKQNLNIYLLRTPLHPNINLKNDLMYLQTKKKEFNNIPFFDFKDFPLSNQQFADYEHLNYSGAESFSLWFNELISKELLSKSNAQEFINDEIEIFSAKNQIYP